MKHLKIIRTLFYLNTAGNKFIARFLLDAKISLMSKMRSYFLFINKTPHKGAHFLVNS